MNQKMTYLLTPLPMSVMNWIKWKMNKALTIDLVLRLLVDIRLPCNELYELNDILIS